jgi:hypothetical protein
MEPPNPAHPDSTRPYGYDGGLASQAKGRGFEPRRPLTSLDLALQLAYVVSLSKAIEHVRGGRIEHSRNKASGARS